MRLALSSRALGRISSTILALGTILEADSGASLRLLRRSMQVETLESADNSSTRAIEETISSFWL